MTTLPDQPPSEVGGRKQGNGKPNEREHGTRVIMQNTRSSIKRHDNVRFKDRGPDVSGPYIQIQQLPVIK
jgi:hypothetical protein